MFQMVGYAFGVTVKYNSMALKMSICIR